MFSKILAVATLVACAQAGVFELDGHGGQGHGSHATSYSSFSHNQASSHHAAPAYQSAPVYHAAPAYQAHAAPAYHAAPATYHSQSVVKTAHVAPVAYHAHAAPVYHAPVHHAAPILKAAPLIKAVPVLKSVHHHEEYPDSHPHYVFQYAVNDEHTHDIKSQHEERDGDVVKGEYSLVQPDGITRTVHYTADDHNGFQAQVSYSGHASHPQQVIKKAVVAAAPAYYHH